MDQSLKQFIKESLEKGLSRDKIEKVLRKAGWEADEVSTGLSAYADVDFPVAVPKRTSYTGAKEAFLYLVTFLTLYLSAWNFGSLIFQFINRGFPDAAIDYNYGGFDPTIQAIRFATASLVIAFPIFLGMSWVVRQAIVKNPEKRTSKIRKWLTYLTLFIAAGVIIGDLIAVVYSFLDGELTTRFLLKSLTIGGIATTVFGYYFWDLKSDDKE